MAKLHLYVAGITAMIAILPIAAAAEDAALLKQAQEIFQPLPKDMATAEFPDHDTEVSYQASSYVPPQSLLTRHLHSPVLPSQIGLRSLLHW